MGGGAMGGQLWQPPSHGEQASGEDLSQKGAQSSRRITHVPGDADELLRLEPFLWSS